MVVHELTYVLPRTGIAEFRSRDGIQAYIRRYLLFDTIHAANKRGLTDTLRRWAIHDIGFADARLTTLAEQRHLPICSVNAADFPRQENTFVTTQL